MIKKTESKKFFKYAVFSGIILCFFTINLIFTAYGFNIRYHQFDMGHNMKYLNCELETNLNDMSLAGEYKNSSQLIQEGGLGLMNNFFVFGFSSVMFTISLLCLIYNCIMVGVYID